MKLQTCRISLTRFQDISEFASCTVLSDEERIVRAARRLLVLAEDIENTDDPVRQWLDELCFAHDLAEVLLTDGLHWALHRVDARVPLKLWNLEAIIEDESAFMDFLRDFAEGV